MRVIEAVEAVNRSQKAILFEKVSKVFDGDFRGKKVALWGLSFKPETDDMREAPSLVMIEKLLAAGATVQAYDPIAMPEARRRLGEQVEYAPDMYQAVREADALILLTEWKQFRLPDWKRVRALMRGRVVADGRNIYDHAELTDEGFVHLRIGK